MRLTVVGCSGSVPGPGSAASCYLVEADGPDGSGGTRPWRVLLDLGSGALGPLQRHADLHALDAVLLSHLHADHCLDLCGLYVARAYDPRRPPGAGRLPVHGPAGTAEHLAAAYGAEVGEGLGGRLDVRPWRVDEPVALGPWRVEVGPALHPVEAYGIRLTEVATGRVLVYTGDTDACDAVVELARGADVLLAEAAFVEGRDDLRGVHLTGRRAAEVARDAGAARLLLTHLPPWNDPAVALAEAVAVGGAPPAEVVRPGQVVEV
ncbi:MBL fold metallo-hydrolase [Pseudokineococcus lusitanus]|uniref:Ribonuclease BN (tRNA processing enzyme) n=1 Tax=Pseudokineococcus lusitanus TaxID=763993 RepID=A0A3N1HU93_9ACTN|nr:ribonuclease BN (tRNA processing enzyme) [Pseudokineococcus lusitanus]